jgi:ParB family chromosome partitioning protein
MARRDVLLGITQANTKQPERAMTSGYTMRGASKSMLSSIGELAAQAAKAEKLTEGAMVVELDPSLVDVSFVSDRMDGGDEAFEELLDAVRERGQDSPILVRPHPRVEGRYMVVFGHRRLRAARELERPVRAVIRPLADIEHVIAQGQENSARENLSFIERAVFAEQLINLGHTRETVQAALAIDAPMLTRMLSVTKRIPVKILNAVGAAKGIGRDRWIELTSLVERPGNLAVAETLISDEAFNAAESNDRFVLLFDALKVKKKPTRKVATAAATNSWAAKDKSVSVTLKPRLKGVSLDITKAEARPFADWISGNLDSLFEAYRQSKQET